jgi:hypothetical protein
MPGTEGIVDVFRLVFLAVGILLFAWSLLRWQFTDEAHRDYGVRRDMGLLMAIIVAGQAGDLLRTRFPEGSSGFLVCSLALLPIAVAALALLWRLFRAYRLLHSETASTSSTLPSEQVHRE